jgi:hypothetical protein
VSRIEVLLLTKPGCHLCDDVRPVVERAVADEPTADLVERDISTDEALSARHWDEIPVVMIDGAVHSIWRVDESRLRRALKEKTA